MNLVMLRALETEIKSGYTYWKRDEFGSSFSLLSLALHLSFQCGVWIVVSLFSFNPLPPPRQEQRETTHVCALCNIEQAWLMQLDSPERCPPSPSPCRWVTHWAAGDALGLGRPTAWSCWLSTPPPPRWDAPAWCTCWLSAWRFPLHARGTWSVSFPPILFRLRVCMRNCTKDHYN